MLSWSGINWTYSIITAPLFFISLLFVNLLMCLFFSACAVYCFSLLNDFHIFATDLMTLVSISSRGYIILEIFCSLFITTTPRCVSTSNLIRSITRPLMGLSTVARKLCIFYFPYLVLIWQFNVHCINTRPFPRRTEIYLLWRLFKI